MPALQILIDCNDHLDQRARELHTKGELKPGARLPGGEIVMVGALPNGMRGAGGTRPSVMVEAKLEDGSTVFLQTSLRLLVSAASALAAKYGTLEEQHAFMLDPATGVMKMAFVDKGSPEAKIVDDIVTTGEVKPDDV